MALGLPLMRKQAMKNELVDESDPYVCDMSQLLALMRSSLLNIHPTYLCRN